MPNNFFNGTLSPATPVTAGMPNLGGGQTMQPGPAPQVPQQQCNVHYVANMNEVLDYPRTPNEHFYFPEQETNIIWIRETDSKGEIKNPLKRLRYEMDEVPFGPEANFVTKQEHQQLYDLVSNMSETLQELMKEWRGQEK